MADAIYRVLPAGFAERALVGGALHAKAFSAGDTGIRGRIHQSPIENAILHRQPIYRCVQVTMSYFELGYLDSVLRIEETELKLFAVSEE